MAWFLIVAAGLFETGFAVLLKQSHRFTQPWPTVGFAACALISFALLNAALGRLEVGPAYATWTGIGAAGTAVVGIALLGESTSPLKIASLALVVAGVIGVSGVYPQVIDAEWMRGAKTYASRMPAADVKATVPDTKITRRSDSPASIQAPPRSIALTTSEPPLATPGPAAVVPTPRSTATASKPLPQAAPLAITEIPDAAANADAPSTPAPTVAAKPVAPALPPPRLVKTAKPVAVPEAEAEIAVEPEPEEPPVVVEEPVFEPPPPVGWDEAVAAQAPDLDSPFPNCFVCGHARADGLHIHAGAVEGREVVAAPWQVAPDTVGPEFVWAALDCPSGMAAMRDGVAAVLGTMSARLARPLVDGETLVVVGRHLSTEGRKRLAATALYDADGAAVAWSSTVWIALQR